jgi:hypothetical protein
MPGSGDASTTGKYHVQFVSSLPISGDMDGDGYLTNPNPALLIESSFTAQETDKKSRILTFKGSIVGDASFIEIDVNLDGSADYSAPITEDGKFTIHFPETTAGAAEIDYAFVRADATSTTWKSVVIDIPGAGQGNNSLQGVSLAIERVVGEPQYAMSGLETVRGKITGNPPYNSLSLEIDYDGDFHVDKYIDVTGSSTFNHQLFMNAISSKGIARLNAVDFTTGKEYVTAWVTFDTVNADSGKSSSASGAAASSAAKQADLFGNLSGLSVGAQGGETLTTAILKATPTSNSPVISYASNLSIEEQRRFLVSGKVTSNSFGSTITVYRKNGEFLEKLGIAAVIGEDKFEFRLIGTGNLKNGEEIFVHQHQGDGSVGSVSKTYIVQQGSDDDKDGPSALIESLGDGDGNNDGVQDSKQSQVATLLESATGTLTTFDAPGAKLVGVSNYIPQDLAEAVFVPQGLYRFEVHNTTVGGIQKVDVYLDNETDFSAWMKLDPKSGEMYEFHFDGETGAVKTAFGFSLYLKDGGRGDDDGLANGIIVDPSGPAYGIEGTLHIGLWPEAPELYEVTVQELPGVPTGLVWDSTVEPGNTTLPDSIKLAMKAALDAYNNTIAANQKDYDANITAAHLAYDGAVSVAAKAREEAIAKANAAYNAAINGYLPADLAGLRNAVTAAQNKHRVAYAKAIKDIDEKAEVDRRSIMQAQAWRNSTAQIAYDEEVNRIRRSFSYSSSQSGARPDPNAMAAAMRDALVRRDTAIIKSGDTAAVEMADLMKRVADAKADAAKAEYQEILNATDALQKAAIDNEYGQKDVIVQAHETLQKELASAALAYAQAVATAKNLRDAAIVDAKKNHAKADNAASMEYGKATSTLFYDAIVINEGSSTSRMSEFRKSVAAALRDKQHAEIQANKEMRDSYIDANSTFDVSVAEAIKTETQAQASAATAYQQALSEANSDFSGKVYSERRADSKESVGTETEGHKTTDTTRREFDKDLASVNKERTKRNALDLQGTRIAQTSNQASFDYGLIKEPEYRTRSLDLEKQAANIRATIAKDTFGTPPSVDEDGNLSNPSTNAAITESHANMQKFVRDAQVTKRKGDVSANQGMTFATSVMDWTHEFESDLMSANHERSEKNDLANKAAQEIVGQAADAWAGVVASTEATLTAKYAAANSAYRIAIAKAAVALQTGLAQDRNKAIQEFAQNNPNNIWAKREAATSAAELARTQALGAAYNAFIGAVAAEQATFTSKVAQREATFINKEIDAILAYQKEIVDSTTTLKQTIRNLEATAEFQRQGALKTFDGEANQANTEQREKHKKAWFKLVCEQVKIALMAKLMSMATDPSVYKRNAEADAASAYSAQMLSADVIHETKIADAYQTRTKEFAEMYESEISGQATAEKSHEHLLADATKTLSKTIATEANFLQQDIADYQYNLSVATINAEEAFTKSIAETDATYDKAMTDAALQFDKDLISLKLSLVKKWAGDGVQDPITRYEQYVIDAYAAQTAWTNASSTAVSTNRKEFAEATKNLMYSYSTLSAIQQRSEAEARKTLAVNASVLQENLSGSVADAVNVESKERSEASSLAIGKTALEGGKLGRSIADKVRNYRGDTIAASSQAAASVSAIEDEYHRLLNRDDKARQTKLEEVQVDLSIGMAKASVSRNDGFGGAIDSWGTDVASHSETRAVSESNAEYDYLQSLVAAFSTNAKGTSEDQQNYNDAIITAATIYEVGAQTAYTVFVASVGSSYTTAISALGEADQTYSKAMATTTSNYHIGVQSDFVSKLELDFGPVYNPLEKWQIRQAKAQLQYLREYAPHYQAYVSSSAKNEADLDYAMAVAEVNYDNAYEIAMTGYVMATGNAFSEISGAAGSDWVKFEAGVTDAMSGHMKENATANKTWVVSMAGVNKTAAIDRLKAETKYYREQAKQTLAVMERNHGRNPSYPISNQYEADYIKDVAYAMYHQDVGSINAGANRAASLIAANKSNIDLIADSQATYLKALATHNQHFDDRIANAEYQCEILIADAKQTQDRATADANYVYHVQSATSYSEAFRQHFSTVKSVALTLLPGSSTALSNQIANLVAINAWAQDLGPHYVTYQTLIAGGAKEYSYATTDAIRAAIGEFLVVAMDFKIQSNADRATAASGRAEADQGAIKANASAQSVYDGKVNSVNREYLVKLAELQRDARIAAKSIGVVDPDPEALTAANKLKQTALEAASKERDEAIAKAISEYFTKGLGITKQSMIGAANAELVYHQEIASAVKTLEHSMNRAYRVFRMTVIDAEADFEIAQVDAEITRLAKLRDLLGDVNSISAHQGAIANRPAEVAKINASRADAIAAAEKSYSEQSAAIDKAYANTIQDAASKNEAAIKMANTQYLDQLTKGPGNLVLPSVTAPSSFGSSVSVGIGLSTNIAEIIKQHSFGDDGGAFTVQYKSGFGFTEFTDFLVSPGAYLADRLYCLVEEHSNTILDVLTSVTTVGIFTNFDVSSWFNYNGDPLDWCANFRIPYVTDFLAGIIQETAGDEFLLTTSSWGLIGYTIGVSTITVLAAKFAAVAGCAGYGVTMAYGAAAGVMEYLGIHALGNLINPAHNDASWLGTLKAGALGAFSSIAGKFLFGGCFIRGTPVLVSALPGKSFSEDFLWSDLQWLNDSAPENPWLAYQQETSAATLERIQVPIESLPIGARVPTKNPNRWEVQNLPEPEEATWAKLTLLIERNDGAVIDAELIRPQAWIQAHGLLVGSLLPISILELNVSGLVNVTAIEACPPIADGEGAVITAKFVTREVNLLASVDVQGTNGEIETITGTPIHPVWSADRQEWVPLGELTEGETLQGTAGGAVVLAVRLKSDSQSVYNVEVDGEHVYQVGNLELLVHNGDVDDCMKGIFHFVAQTDFTETIGKVVAQKQSPVIYQFIEGVTSKRVGNYIGQSIEGVVRLARHQAKHRIDDFTTVTFTPIGGGKAQLDWYEQALINGKGGLGDYLSNAINSVSKKRMPKLLETLRSFW